MRRGSGIANRFKRETWSPWTCGALLGLCAVACLVLEGHRLGAIGGFETAASFIARALGVQGCSLYFSVMRLPQVDERFLIYAGMIVGACAGALSSGTFKPSLISSGQWKERFGSSVVKRWVVMFLGCALIGFGAGVAGGCTSGMGVSGTMQLAPAGVVFFAGAFAAGIVVAALLYRKDGKR